VGVIAAYNMVSRFLVALGVEPEQIELQEPEWNDSFANSSFWGRSKIFRKQGLRPGATFATSPYHSKLRCRRCAYSTISWVCAGFVTWVVHSPARGIWFCI